VLVFPSISAVSLHEYIAERSLLVADELTGPAVSEGSENDSVSSESSRMTFVFIDCTWYQVHRIATDPRLSSKFFLLKIYDSL